MIYNVIAAAAVVNVVLGVFALARGRSGLNVSFFFLSFLLGLWNIFIVLWAHIPVFGRLNFIVISLIPVAGIYFVLALFRIEKGAAAFSRFVILGLALGIIAYTAGTFFFAPLLAWYDSKWCKIMIFAYAAISMLYILAVLVHNYGRIRFKQEKMKIRLIIAAFLILYAGGMIDLAAGAGLFNSPARFMGNICNVIYAAIIFYAIFRLRLFNIEALFRHFAAYTLIALAAGSAYVTAAVFLAKEITVLAILYFIMTLLLVYYAKRIHGLVFLFVEKFSGPYGVETARRECQKITAEQAGEDEKIAATLALLKKYLEMGAAAFIRGGDYYTAAWETEGAGFKKLVDAASVRPSIIIRYETKDRLEIDLLDRFGADVIMPLVYGGSVTGVIAGKKQTSDISFTQEEVELILDAASAITVYMKARAMQKQQQEDENMKRIGMMARQMAHEIKNPLAALWGAAQLIEGKNASDGENLAIIKEEMKRLTNILDSWRDFSREMKLDRSLTDIGGLAAEAVKLVSLQAGRVKIVFGPPAEKITAQVDPEKIKQVLINVLLNAIDASALRQQPVVEISAAGKKRYADIKIRDNGSGIKKEELLRVKEPMFTSKPKGSGLGLAISERIMKAHGGELLLDSDGQTYTEVTLSIPLE